MLSELIISSNEIEFFFPQMKRNEKFHLQSFSHIIHMHTQIKHLHTQSNIPFLKKFLIM